MEGWKLASLARSRWKHWGEAARFARGLIARALGGGGPHGEPLGGGGSLRSWGRGGALGRGGPHGEPLGGGGSLRSWGHRESTGELCGKNRAAHDPHDEAWGRTTLSKQSSPDGDLFCARRLACFTECLSALYRGEAPATSEPLPHSPSAPHDGASLRKRACERSENRR